MRVTTRSMALALVGLAHVGCVTTARSHIDRRVWTESINHREPRETTIELASVERDEVVLRAFRKSICTTTDLDSEYSRDKLLLEGSLGIGAALGAFGAVSVRSSSLGRRRSSPGCFGDPPE